MECDLSVVINKNRAMLDVAFKQQSRKIKKYFTKPCDDEIEKMLILAADINGQIEELEALLYIVDASDEETMEFARDCTDLDIEPRILKRMCARNDLSYFLTKYDATKVLVANSLAHNSFLKHSEQFIDAVRNLDTANAAASYLAKHKCAAIKHLCALEYLVGVTINKNTNEN
ncbi:hypothetical protein [Epiphyas postvittana nucleopolyhedrovirus]|uniref:Protein kinase interacting protein n=1 Tax=Epiphyas postvittana nucleopolyhedrovirus TaxID=70600 RepID=Q91GL5_NPVEP|nr:hypothetical protein [Epiphyas postvittana nucleopolyhedrovirus]AAK85600.1 unknown [Epiphyas postvittana nucleopolyhedrovirus]